MNIWLKLLIYTLGLTLSVSVSATYVVNVNHQVIKDDIIPGATASIELTPTLPLAGESFEIKISGTYWADFIPLEEDLYIRFDPSLNGISITATTEWEDLPNIDEKIGELAEYEFTISVGPEFVESVNLDEPVYVSFSIKLHDTMRWYRFFDFKRGLHEIPPRLGSGYWISSERPYQGLLIQQQGDVVVFYEMTYHRNSGLPVWLYADARFQGNTANGQALTPVWRVPTDSIHRQPLPDDIDLLKGTGSIRVLGYNKVRALIGTGDQVLYAPHAYGPSYATYSRWHFGTDVNGLPPYIPDFSGRWNLYGFDGQSLSSQNVIELLSGKETSPNTFQFDSIDQSWTLECIIKQSQAGSCELRSDSILYTFNIDDFNGNVATGSMLEAEVGVEGVFMREGYVLPILAH